MNKDYAHSMQDDTISRQAAIDAVINADYKDCGVLVERRCRKFEEALRSLPTAQPEPVKKGRWVKMSDINGYYYACSECGEELFRRWVFDKEFDIFPHLRSVDKPPYCPNCGAKMEGAEE